MYRSEEYGAASAGWPAVGSELKDPKQLDVQHGLIGKFAAPAISLAVLIVAAASMRHLRLGEVEALVPRQPLFWLIFALTYVTAPFADWLIFRRLWSIPGSGMLPLLRKFIGNELLLGYVGELYFYAWARQRADMAAAPFGAIKDVAVLSALVGNFVTLVLIATAIPFLDRAGIGSLGSGIAVSVGIVLLTSCAAMGFRNRLFTLPATELRGIAGLHLLRVVAMLGLTATMWHFALPMVALSWWLVMATMRMLLSRLPLMPNKDLVFAGVAVALVGPHVEIASLMAMMASLILATHILLGIGLALLELVTTRTGERT